MAGCRRQASYNAFSFGADDPQTVSDLERELDEDLRAHDYDAYPRLQYLSSDEESEGQLSDDGLWNEEDRRGFMMDFHMDELYRIMEDDLAACNAEQEELDAVEAVDDFHRIIRHEREVEEWPECAPRQYDETQQAADYRFRVTILQQWWRGA